MKLIANSSFKLIALAATATLFGCILLNAQSPQAAPSPTSWEYEVTAILNEFDLNKKGRAGYELISVVYRDEDRGTMYFKRSLP